MNDKIAFNANNSVEALDCCDMPILRKRVKKNSKIKQQQTLITSKILCPFKKTKFKNIVNIPSDKPKAKKIISYKSPEKI